MWHANEINYAGLGPYWNQFRALIQSWRKAGVYASYDEVARGRIGIGASAFGADHKIVGGFVFILAARRAGKERVELLAQEAKATASEVSNALVGRRTRP